MEGPGRAWKDWQKIYKHHRVFYCCCTCLTGAARQTNRNCNRLGHGTWSLDPILRRRLLGSRQRSHSGGRTWSREQFGSRRRRRRGRQGPSDPPPGTPGRGPRESPGSPGGGQQGVPGDSHTPGDPLRGSADIYIYILMHRCRWRALRTLFWLPSSSSPSSPPGRPSIR